jgi:TP901 family phage tail tape measure protein
VSSTSLDFLLTATDHASPKFAAFGGNIDQARAHLVNFGKIASVALAGAAVASVKMAADFQETTTQLVTGAGESIKNLDMVKKGVLALAPAVGVGPEALAKGMYFVESAGYHAASGLTVLKAAAEGAKIGGADMTVVAQGLTTALKDYHLPASAAAGVTSELIATVSQGKTAMADLSGSLQNVLPFAASFGVGLKDVAGAMATMTGEGIDAAQASTMLKFTMMSMAHETPKGTAALKSIGLTAADVHDSLGTKGLAGTMAMLTDAIGKKFPAGSTQATAALADIAGGTRGMGAMLALTGGNMSTFTKNIKTIGGAATEAGGHVKGWALTQEDLATQLAKAQAALQVMAVKLGTVLIPVVTKLATAFVPLIQTLSPILTKLASAFATLITQGMAKAGPVVNVLMAALNKMLPVIGKLILVVLKVGMEALMPLLPIIAKLVASVGGALSPILKEIAPIFGQLGKLVGMVLTAVGPLIPLVLDLVKAFLPLLAPIIQLVSTLLTPLITLLTWLLKPILAVVELGINVLVVALKWLIDIIAKQFQVQIRTLGDVVGSVANFIISAANLIGFGFKVLWETFIQPIINFISADVKGLGIVFGWLWTNAIKPVVDFISPAIQLVGSVIGTVFGAIGSTIKGAFDGVVGFIKGIINSIIDVINGALSGINMLIKAVDKIPGVNFPTLGTIPHLATGGLVTQGGMAVVGERGPEIVKLPTGSRVHPNGSSGGVTRDDLLAFAQQIVDAFRTDAKATANGAIDNLGKQALQMRRQGVTA